MKRATAGKAGLRRASISFNVAKPTPKAPTIAATGLDTEIVKSIRSAWRSIEAEFNRRPRESVHIEDLLKRGLGANAVAGRRREYLAALHGELLSRKKFRPVAVEDKGGTGIRWRLSSQVPTVSVADHPAADPRYADVALTARATDDLTALRETTRENDALRLTAGYICALDHQRLMTGVLPIRRRDKSLFPSQPDPAEIILHPDKQLAVHDELSAWIDSKSACIFGLEDLFQALPIPVGSRFKLARLGKDIHYSLAIELDRYEIETAPISRPEGGTVLKRASTSFRAVAGVLMAAGAPTTFRHLHRLVNQLRPMSPETLAAVLSDWQCFASTSEINGEHGWRFDSSELSSGRHSVRAARLALQKTLSDLETSSNGLSESIALIFKKTQRHSEKLAVLSAAQTEDHVSSDWTSRA